MCGDKLPRARARLGDMRITLSVLTDPIPVGRYCFSEYAKRVARKLRDVVKPPPVYVRSPYRGHFAVTRSLVEGLRAIGVAYNYNPQRLEDVGNTVVVLSSLSALQQAIQLKRRGVLKRLLAGPNLVEFPSDARDLICAPEVDICIAPGPLTCKLYIEDCPELKDRCLPWPAGVDADYWCAPPSDVERAKIVVYDKQVHRPTDSIEPYVRVIEARGYEAIVLTYGYYTKEGYKSLLQQSQLLIGFSAAESQGIAWAEAWAADVPTLMWYKNRHSFNHPRSRGRFFETSPAPYLTEHTGRFFRNIGEFERIFSEWESNRGQYHPRAWVLANMTDEAVARRLCEMADIEAGK